MDARGRLTLAVGIALVLVGLGLYVAVPSMGAPLVGLVLAAVGAVTVVVALVLAGSPRR